MLLKTKIMKKLLIIFLLLNLTSFGQVKVLFSDGNANTTRLGMGITVNKGSTLIRKFITITDKNYPLGLKEVGITTFYNGTGYRFSSVGFVYPHDTIVAYEIHHVLYNVFGEHIKTLSDLEVNDIFEPKDISGVSNWYASENQVSEYLICVSYVANVRTKKGMIWHYDYKTIEAELIKIQLKYDEEYMPSKNDDK